MTDVLTVAATELKRRIRSRSALVNAFLAPLLLAVVFGTLLGSAGSASFDIAVVDLESTPVSEAVATAIIGIGDDPETEALNFSRIEDVSIAEQEVSDGAVGAALLVGPDGSIEVLKSAERPVTAQVGESIAHSVVGTIQRGEAEPVLLEPLPLGGRTISTMAYFGAGMAGLLLFFTVGLAGKSMLEDRDNSTLSRMLSGPTKPSAILFGKVLAVVSMSVLGFIVVWLVTTFAFGATWGPALGVLVMILATVLAVGGLALFIGSFATSPQQNDTLTSVAAFLLALIGGAFIPPADTPAGLRVLRNLSPNGLSLRGFTVVSVDGVSLGGLAVPLLGLATFALVFGTLGLLRVGKSLAR